MVNGFSAILPKFMPIRQFKRLFLDSLSLAAIFKTMRLIHFDWQGERK